jgi:multidrug resistance efflux pump
MNASDIVFPTRPVELRLRRPANQPSTLAAEQLRLQQDLAALQEREENLRRYEEHLRAWQAQIEQGRNPAAVPVPSLRPGSLTPFPHDESLKEAWAKLHRARELLEVEQRHLRDDRLLQLEEQQALAKREAALAAREAKLEQREQQLAARETRTTSAGLFGLTRAPFHFARSVLPKS